MSDYPTVQPTNLKGYQKLIFKITQSVTNHPRISLFRQSMKTNVSAVRTDVGRYVVSIPNASNIMNANMLKILEGK